MSGDDSVDITGIITNLQKLVLNLSQEHALDKTVRSALKIRDMANCPDGTLSISNSKFPISAQLGDLQQQNADLKNQYEDCVIALNGMMYLHRLEMMKFVNSKDILEGNEELLKQPSEEEEEEEKVNIPLPVFQDLDDVFQASGINQTKIIDEIERLKFDNALIRELVSMESYDNIDVDALLDKIENQTPMAKSPASSSHTAEDESEVGQRSLRNQETIKFTSEEEENQQPVDI